MPDDFSPDARPISGPGTVAVRDPSEVPGMIGQTIKRNIIPTAAMTAADLGAAALAPETGGMSLILPAVASGLTNVATTKLLRRSLGGEPGRSKTSAFLWGAIPSLGGGALARGVERGAIRKGGEAAYDAIASGLEKQTPSAAEQGERVSSILNRPLKRPDIKTGTAQTDATFGLRDAIMNPIQRMRRKLGEPIGAAYETLKGNALPAPVEDLGGITDQIRSSNISPISPRTSALLDEGKALSKRLEREETQMPGPGQPVSPILTQYGKTQAAATEMTPADLGAPPEAEKPPTLDEVRNLRQRVNAELRTAKGGDLRALSLYEHALDEKLLPYLPASINRDRALYAGFIRRFPYARLNQLGQMGTDRQVGSWMFKLEPELSREVIDSATGSERQQIGNAFKDYVLRQANPNEPMGQQMAAIHKAMQEYVADGTVKKLFGSQAERELTELFHAPAHRADLLAMLKRPDSHDAFVSGWTDEVKQGGPNAQAAAQAGFQKFANSLPPAEYRALTKMAPGVSMPVIPTPQEAIESGLRVPSSGAMVRYGARRAGFAGPMAAGRVLMGSPMGAAYGAASGLAFAGIAASSVGYRALLDNGGASLLAKLYSSSSAREAGRITFKLLVAMGARTGQEATYQGAGQ